MAATVRVNGITVAYEIEGDDRAPCVLLIMGLGMQLIAWPDAFRHGLLQAGFRVLRLDNRDAGLSSHLHGVHTPNLLWSAFKHRIGLPIAAPYTLHDMVQDTAALLNALQIDRVHAVGVSMGGMIAQGLAAHHPSHVRTLTSIMSSSGARHLPQARPEITRALLSRPKDARDKAAVVEHLLGMFRLIGSPAYPMDEAELRARVTRAVERSYDPAGTVRQMLAIAASGDRSDELAQIRCPTLVMHGKADPLVPIACGEDTARKIEHARFVPIHGMGHDLPPGVVKILLEQLVPFLKAHTA